MRRSLPLLLAPVLVAVLPAAPAGAHASLSAQFPADGEVLAPSGEPTNVRYEFNEPVTVAPAGMAIRDGGGALVSGAAGTAPDAAEVATVTSSAALAAGRYALETSVLSKDGHQLVFAYGFAVGPEQALPAAPLSLELAAADGVSAPLAVGVDGAGPGRRTVTLPAADGITGGEVRLTCRRAAGERVAKVRAPFVWKLAAPQGGTATASGYLPVPCTYTVRVVLERAFPAAPSLYVTAADRGFPVTG